MEKLRRETFVEDFNDFKSQGGFDKLLNSTELKSDGVELARLANMNADSENVQLAINNYVNKLNDKITASKGTPQQQGDTFLEQYMSLEKGDKVSVRYGSVVRGTNDKVLVVTKGRTFFAKNNVERIILKDPDNLKGVKYYLYNRQGKISFAVGDLATSLKSIDVIKKPKANGARVDIRPKSANSKLFVVYNLDLEQPWANEYFKSEAEAVKFAEQNGLRVQPTKAKANPAPKPAPKKVGDTLKEEILAGKYKNATKREILAIAQSYNVARRPESIKVDNKRDNSKRIEPTPENLVRWVKAPGEYDFIGADNYKENTITVTFKQKKEAFWKRLMKK
jgi:hypothetical protein